MRKFKRPAVMFWVSLRMLPLLTCAPSSLQLGAESLVLNLWRYAAILSIKLLCKNSIGVRFPSAEC
ncbi:MULTISPECIES: hypothetical protein, partial [Roseobacteraceae]|uniref:hypothetical protein n=1 Tax=Roseobacteraceae TaxID=2854170 RepID=UPI0032978341